MTFKRWNNFALSPSLSVSNKKKRAVMDGIQDKIVYLICLLLVKLPKVSYKMNHIFASMKRMTYDDKDNSK